MLLFLLIFFALQFLIGYLAGRKIKNEADFLLGGRHIPSWLLMFSLFATWFGAETCLGTSGAVYLKGLAGARADPFGYTLCLILMGLLIAPKIWNQKYATLADFYRDRYGIYVEKLSVFILLLGSIIWGAAQIRAMGQVIASMTDLPVNLMMIVSFFVVVGYGFLGGLMGDILTDFVQGIILIIGLSLLLYFIVNHEGIEILKIAPERLTLFEPGETLFERMDRWAVPILGSLVAQESIARVLASKSASVATRASLFAGVIYIFVGSLPVILGLIGPSLIVNLPDNERFLIELSSKYLPPLLQMILVGSLVSAILSTIDSILLAGGGLFSHNLFLPLLKNPSQERRLLISRLSVVLMALLALVVALFSESIYGLVESASAFGTAGIFVITVLGLWSKFGKGKAALGALLGGLMIYPIASVLLEFSAPFLISIGGATFCYITIAVLEKTNRDHQT